MEAKGSKRNSCRQTKTDQSVGRQWEGKMGCGNQLRGTRREKEGRGQGAEMVLSSLYRCPMGTNVNLSFSE